MDRTMKKGYVVFERQIGGYQPIGRTDDVITVFDTEKEANADIDEMISDVAEAVREGNMDSEYDRDDYEAIAVKIPNHKAKFGQQRMIFTINDETYTMRRIDEDYKLFKPFVALKMDGNEVVSIRRSDESIFDTGQPVKFKFGKNTLWVKGKIEKFICNDEVEANEVIVKLVGMRTKVDVNDLQHDY